MFEIIFIVFVLFFFAWGLGEFIHNLKLFVFRKKPQGKNLVISLLFESTAKKQVNYILEKYRWNGHSYADKIIFIGEHLSEEICAFCNDVCKSDDNIFFCDKTTFLHIIDSFYEEDYGKSGRTSHT